MEIISYVQNQQEKRAFPLFIKRNVQSLKSLNKRNYHAEINHSIYTINEKEFTAQKVNYKFSIKSFLIETGKKGFDFYNLIKNNIKKISISILIIITFASSLYFVLNRISYNKNHTNQLYMNSEDFLEIERLNSLMENFALENTTQYDENGNILNIDVSDFVPNFREPVSYNNYTVKKGDTISGIAKKFGLYNISTLISVNDIGNVRQLAAGQKLKIPSLDGIVYTVKKGDSLASIVKQKNVKLEDLVDVNELANEELTVNQVLFLPGVGLDSVALKSALGDLFKLPITAKFRWSSPYGSRIDPIANVQSFHTGVDMACPTGTPILASMSGKITVTGVSRVYGNYVIIDHGNGYQTLYAHMSKIIAKKGQWISQGSRIGLVGSTGYSTGSHLHFSVYKNGKMIDPMSVLK
ncbi:MAG: M23 family metallopeptidase [Treponema sp.]|jgi:murein DD-endopeptidase MepM/ murein hydrolase activator NlpD|nr:M23 family metallopeptidase [Treponema sp.]